VICGEFGVCHFAISVVQLHAGKDCCELCCELLLVSEGVWCGVRWGGVGWAWIVTGGSV
jgi:hypothetical protein